MERIYVQLGEFKITEHQLYVISVCFKHAQYWQMADEIGIKEGTFRQELSRLYARFGIHTFRELLILAQKAGFDHTGLLHGLPVPKPAEETASV